MLIINVDDCLADFSANMELWVKTGKTSAWTPEDDWYRYMESGLVTKFFESPAFPYTMPHLGVGTVIKDLQASGKDNRVVFLTPVIEPVQAWLTSWFCNSLSKFATVQFPRTKVATLRQLKRAEKFEASELMFFSSSGILSDQAETFLHCSSNRLLVPPSCHIWV